MQSLILPFPSVLFKAYTRAVTRSGWSIGFVFALYLLLGNVCLVGSVYAASPQPGTDALLSREIPMSFNVVKCTWVMTDEGWMPTPGSPCESGKCLKKDLPETPCVFGLHMEVTAAELPPSPLTEFSMPWTDIVPPLTTESPPDLFALATVVMRQ